MVVTSRWHALVRSVAPWRAVLAVTAASLFLRVFDLAGRVAHWDEGRVGWWVLKAAETGQWQYRPIIHGPFIQHTARLSTTLLGPSDFSLRLPVALVGGLLPLAALLFYRSLATRETVALAAVLAVDPLLLYYGRFFRSDLPVAAAALVTLGCLLRLRQTGRRRWLVAAACAFALALTMKENALLYPLSWLGAGALTVAWLRWRGEWSSNAQSLRAISGRFDARTLLRRWGPATMAAVISGLSILVLFYAPRSPTPGTLGLSQALADPSRLPALVGEATLGSWGRLSETWIGGRSHRYAPYLAHYLYVLTTGSGGVAVLAVVGAIEGRDRPFVVFCTLWGLSAVAGYPYAADIKAPWLVVHAVVPLAVPAAVGGVALIEECRRRAGAIASRSGGVETVGQALGTVDGRRAVMFALVLTGAVGQVVVMGVGANYTHPTDRQLIIAHGAQPGGDWRPVLERIDEVSATNPSGEADIAFYGPLAGPDGSANDHRGAGWFRRQPLSWYVESHDLTAINVHSPTDLEDPPPVVVGMPANRSTLDSALPGYRRVERAIFRHGQDTTYNLLGYEKQIRGQAFLVYIEGTDRPARSAGG